MAIYFISVFVSVLANLLVPSVADTAIVYKESFRKESKFIAEGIENFRDFVNKSSLFIDKSLLIRELLEDAPDRILTLNYPRGWGQSLNLHMLKTFVEIEVDENGKPISPRNRTRNYRLFKNGELVYDDVVVDKLKKPLLIAEDNIFFNEYQGKVPVIFLNLSRISAGCCFDDVHTEISNRLADCFAGHLYMKEVLRDIVDNQNRSEPVRRQAQRDLKLFKTILWKEATTNELLKSLNFLSKILAEHFKKKVFIMVDSYDTPYNETFLCGVFPRSEEESFLDFYRKFNFYTFISNPHMYRSILTGVIPLSEGNLLRGLPNVKEFTVLQDSAVHEFYGFTRDRVNELFDLYQLEKNVSKKAITLYHGQAAGAEQRTKILEPSNIVHLLNTGKFLRTDGFFLGKYYDVDSIRSVLNALFSGLQLAADFNNITLDKEDFKNLQNAPYYNEKIHGPVLNSFLRYAYGVGYVTCGNVAVTEFESKNKQLSLRLATGEMFVVLGEGLARFYGNKFQVDINDIRDLCTQFHDDLSAFVKTRDTTSANLTLTLERFFSYIFRPHGYIVNENQEMTDFILDYLTIFVNSYRRFPSFGKEILLIEHDIGIAIGGTFNRSNASEALEIAKKGAAKLTHFRHPKTKLIGINAKPNSTIELIASDM